MEFEKNTERGYNRWTVGDKYKYDVNCFYSCNGMNNDEIYEIMSEIISLLKTKGLTMRQAQSVLNECKKAILDTVIMD